MKRIFCIFVLCVSSIFSATAFADYPTPTVIQPVEASYAQPFTEETKWVTRIHNGNLETRLWSITYNKWLTDWIIIGPVNP